METDYRKQKQALVSRVQERLGYGRDFSDTEIEETIEEVLLENEELCYYPVEIRLRLKKELFDSLRRLDLLQLFVEDSDVTEIMINGKDHIFVEKAGRLCELDIQFDSTERLNDVIQKIVAGCNRVVNESSPIVDARLDDGSRVNVVLNPIAINGPIVTIRRFPENPITMEELISYGSLTPEAADFLKKLVEAGYNIFISGANRIIGLSQMTFRKQRVQTT